MPGAWAFACKTCRYVVAAAFFAEGVSAAHNLAVRQASSTTVSSVSPTTVSSTSTAASTTPSPILSFSVVPQAVTCASIVLSWFYAGPSDHITLVVTNVGVPQGAAPLSISSSASSSSSSSSVSPSSSSSSSSSTQSVLHERAPTDTTLTLTIATNVDPRAMQYTWSAVNVPQGWYVFNALMPTQSYNETSGGFYVHQGTNTSCISSGGTTSQSHSSTYSPPKSSSTLAPASVSGSGRSLNTGVIVGIILAVAAVIVAVLVAWLYLLRKQRTRGSGDTKGFGSRGWGGLSSSDSRGMAIKRNGEVYPSNAPRHQTSRAESVGTTLGCYSEEGVGAEKLKGPYASLDEQGMALAMLPVLSHHPSKTQMANGKRTYSNSSTTSQMYPEFGQHPPNSAGRGRSVPDPTPLRRSVDSTSYPPVSASSALTQINSAQFAPADLSRTHSLSTSNTHQGSSTALLPPPPQAPKRQNSSGRKRKPVPAYDASLEPTPLPVPLVPIPPPSPTNPHYQNHVSELSHKSSFGPGSVEGKPLHYLIPDLPMPAKD